MHYAVPRIFASAGRLAHFYTDICATKGWPRIVNSFPATFYPPPSDVWAGSAAQRRADGADDRVFRLWPPFRSAPHARQRRCGRDLSRDLSRISFFQRWWPGAASWRGWALCLQGDALEQMRAAKQQGLWTAVEQMIAPRDVVEALLAQEMARFPNGTGPAQIIRTRAYSPTGRKRVAACGCHCLPVGICSQARCRVAVGRKPGVWSFPMGSMLPLRSTDRHACQDRSGSDRGAKFGLRKGSPYVVGSARLMEDRARFRMAGRVRAHDDVKQQISQWVELRGVVPRAQIIEEFRWGGCLPAAVALRRVCDRRL